VHRQAQAVSVETVRAKLTDIGIDIDPAAKVASLSIGARQMVEIAKAVMFDARVIALDEPTSSLSSRESEILFSLIDQAEVPRGTVILYVSHRLDEIFRLCDSLTVLRDGRLAAHHADVAKVTREQIISEMVGREISQHLGLARTRPLGPTRGLQAQNLAGPKLAKPDSAFRGPEGGDPRLSSASLAPGRSEMTRLLYGADAPLAGATVTVDGEIAVVLPTVPKHSIRAGIVLCPEDRKFDGIIQGRSIEENITISSRRHFSHRSAC
jgi:L-arabinose transport system ATP-binding protein